MFSPETSLYAFPFRDGESTYNNLSTNKAYVSLHRVPHFRVGCRFKSRMDLAWPTWKFEL